MRFCSDNMENVFEENGSSREINSENNRGFLRPDNVQINPNEEN